MLRPDLNVPTVTFTPAAIAPGGNITVSHVVKNLALAPGNAPLSASRLLLSTDQTVAGQVADLGTVNVPAITAGGMTTVTRSAQVPVGLAARPLLRPGAADDRRRDRRAECERTTSAPAPRAWSSVLT